MTDINHPVCVSSLPLSFFFICNLAARLSEGRRKKARIDLVFLQRGKEGKTRQKEGKGSDVFGNTEVESCSISRTLLISGRDLGVKHLVSSQGRGIKGEEEEHRGLKRRGMDPDCR